MYTIVETLALAGAINPAMLQYVRENNFTVVKGGAEQLMDEDGERLPPAQSAVDAAYEDIRQWLYRETTDPLFMKCQRGEVEKDVWLSAVQSVKSDWSTPVVA